MYIRIKQDYPIRGYQIPTFGLRELTNGELVEADSKLGKALMNYFPGICVLEGEPKPTLLVEEPIAEANVVKVPEIPDGDAEVEEPVESQVSMEETVEEKPLFGRKAKK